MPRRHHVQIRWHAWAARCGGKLRLRVHVGQTYVPFCLSVLDTTFGRAWGLEQVLEEVVRNLEQPRSSALSEARLLGYGRFLERVLEH